MVNQTAVSSSNIKRVGYENGTLFILFNSGVAYNYEGVPEQVYKDMLEAESAGKFFHSHIKGKYTYRKLEDNPLERRQAERRKAA